ncbi:hypothetical protein QR680_009962 [Steinernema hermaphroditum]|uniref:HIT domain-containing protein n=1 Tax=Steinernema hermaphroditum TaxID=289476 RepID=A0AA39IM89_9BILA|nr:hypothetical protein QR680_009962 [Steinernema hermaphroditum]
MASLDESIFAKVIREETNSTFVYQDDHIVAFYDNDDLHQVARHFFVVPKHRIDMLENATADGGTFIGKLMCVAVEVANQLEYNNGYCVVINNGPDCCPGESWLHLHVSEISESMDLGGLTPSPMLVDPSPTGRTPSPMVTDLPNGN